jgi:hypothetical protein
MPALSIVDGGLREESMPDLCLSLFGPALCQSVDFYCERTSASLLAEPLNAISNLAFIVAGWFAWREFQQRQTPDYDPLLAAIVAMIPIVGVGSLLFHTFATQWASWADVIPILIFMLLYLWLAMRRYFGWPRWLTAAAVLAFLLSTLYLEARVPGQVLWGGAMYLPTLAVCVAIVLAPVNWDKDARRIVAAAVAVFILSFTFRTLDAPMCARLPIGTHFLWHICNATVLYLLAHAAILHGRAVPGVRGDLAAR